MTGETTQPIDLFGIFDPTTDEVLELGAANAEDAIELAEKLVNKYRAQLLRSVAFGEKPAGFKDTRLQATVVARSGERSVEARFVLGLLNGSPAYRFFALVSDSRQSKAVTPMELQKAMPSARAFGEWLELVEKQIDVQAQEA